MSFKTAENRQITDNRLIWQVMEVFDNFLDMAASVRYDANGNVYEKDYSCQDRHFSDQKAWAISVASCNPKQNNR